MTRETVRHAAAATRRLDIAVLAVLAYLPALLSSPGRMPADTKLYLYTDPGGLIGRAASTFEPDQFAGWVPHQQITYLWPSGPWFWIFDTVSVPDWIAHRLWIGTILFAAGLGARSCARHVGHTGLAAFAAAVVYQLSPYLLPYVSRTSLLLLPWAGLGWIMAATIRATRVAGAPGAATPWWLRWRDPALIALLVATVGSTNATSLAMIVPGPVVWILLAVWGRHIGLRPACSVVARVTVACVSVSLWWMAMLIVQSRAGAPVLVFSETLEDVSRNASAPEVFRGMGYWLFYGRDAFSATTTASIDHLTRSSLLAISFALPILGLIGLGFGRGAYRQFAAVLTAVGMLLAVGVHPVDGSSPLMRLVTGDSEGGLALALRSSTRAVPLVVLGLALGTAALVERASTARLGRRWPVQLSPRRLAAGSVALLAVANMPSIWSANLVDPAIDRESELPTAWTDAAESLDTAADTRVLQLPGAEFGAFDWGYTSDQPVVSATDLPVVTRDLLPLGSAPAMDLLYALDNRVQSGTLEPAALAPIARLFGVSTVWLANDLDALRFRTPPAGTVAATIDGAPGLGMQQTYGEPAAPGPVPLDLFGRPLVDADALRFGPDPVAPVAVVDVIDPEPIVRVGTEVIVHSGSGDGIVDAAAAGLIDGSEVLLLGTAAIDPRDSVIVTDSNRDRANHWRSSQDVTGHTEPGGPDPDVLVATAADQRLGNGSGTDDPDSQTIAVQRGPVTAIASSYGEPFAYRPERRAVMAIDGDHSTAWTVADHADPVGELLRLTPNAPIDALVLHQFVGSTDQRTITSIGIDRSDGTRQHVALTPASTDGTGQLVRLDAVTDQPIDVVITGVTADSATTAAAQSGVGFSEIETGLGPTTEYIRPPIDTLGAVSADQASLDIVLTRDRVTASHWRSDPEPTLRRLLPLQTAQSFEVGATLGLDEQASDAAIAELVGDEGAVADRRLPGVEHRGAAAVDGDSDTAWLTPADDQIGATLTLTSVTEPITSLDIVQPGAPWSTITSVIVTADGASVEAPVPSPDADGRSRVDLPGPVGAAGGSLDVTIAQVEPSTVIERRYGDTMTMPAGIVELSSSGIPAPPAVDGVVTSACDIAALTLDGVDLRVAFETSGASLLRGEPIQATACDDVVDLDTGEHTIDAGPLPEGLTLDRVVLSTRQDTDEAAGDSVRAVVEVIATSTRGRVTEVDCPDGCWLVFAMGHNEAWSADIDGASLGAPTVVDGGFNGWWIEPDDRLRRVELSWTAQGPVTVGLVVSLLVALGLLAVLIASLFANRRRRADDTAPLTAEPDAARRLCPSGAFAVGVAVALGILVAPLWGLVAGALATADIVISRHRPRPLLAASGTLMVVAGAVGVVVIERRDAPFPNAGWTTAFDDLHGLVLVGVLLVAASTLVGRQSSD